MKRLFQRYPLHYAGRFARPSNGAYRRVCESEGQRGGVPGGRGDKYDVVVVGGGHAGTEAAAASARMGARTLLVTHKFSTIGEMSCNPSFGGIGKGHLLREIDALDGLSPQICDQSAIQFRVLNKSKGPAVWGIRAQIDRDQYRSNMQEAVRRVSGLEIREDSVEDLVLSEGCGAGEGEGGEGRLAVTGVCLGSGEVVQTSTVILTTGTFLRGSINIGLESRPAGRMGDQPAIGLSKTLERAKFELKRLKTGTPPRVDARTINTSCLLEQKGDDPPVPFSFLNEQRELKLEQKSCFLTYTNAATHQIIHEGMHLNRHVTEETTGPRYCPSIESKVLRFGNRNHQVWLEPEGLSSNVIYPNGISCTLPEDMQQHLVRTIAGLEQATVLQPGYGVEYDCIDPRQLFPSLETRLVQRLFLAGQINGTTGYEEAASQGIIAGINAALHCQGRDPFLLDRGMAYIGVLIDDLTTNGTTEPYRMFTSRAEYRLLLRPDNADVRLTRKGYLAGCVSRQRMDLADNMEQQLTTSIQRLKGLSMHGSGWIKKLKLSNVSDDGRPKSAWQMLLHPEVTVNTLAAAFPSELGDLGEQPALARRLDIEGHYSAMVAKQETDITDLRRSEGLQLPADMPYSKLGLSTECREKLEKIRPTTLGAASRIDGVTPAALLLLVHYVKRTNSNISATLH